MAFIYNLTDSWNDAATTWNGIKLAVTNTASDSSSKLLNLTVSGATTASFVVDKSGNLDLNGKINKITFTAPATAATFTLADNSTFATVGGYATTFTFTGTTAVTFPTSGTVTALGNSSTGSGDIVLATSPTLVTPNLGTPSAVMLTNGTGLPVSTGISGFGTGVAAALGVNVGSSGALVVNGGALGTPSSGTLTNCTGYTVGNISGLGSGVATWLGTPSSANLRAAVTDETGTGSLVFATSPSLVTPDLGTPSAVTLTNATGLPISTGVSGLGANVATFLATPSSANLRAAVTDETGTGSLVFSNSPTFDDDITLGVSSTTQGELIFANTSANTVKLRSSNSTAANYTLTLPAAAPVNGYYLQTDNLGQLSWAAGGGGGGGSPGGSNTQIQYNNAGAFGGDAAFTFVNGTGTATMSLGVASTTSGVAKLYNSASANAITIASGNNSAAWTLTLPTSAGTNGYFLQTDGAGNTSWAAAAAGITVNSTAISGGTSGRILYDNAGTVGEKTVTGTGDVVLATSPTLITPNLGTPSAATLTNATGLPISTGVSGLGTGIATALAVNVGTAGAPVVNGGALGTPSSATLTNATGLPISTGVSGLGTNVATALGNTVNGASGIVALDASSKLPAVDGSQLTALNANNISTGTLAVARGGTGITSFGTGVATAFGNNTNAASGLLVLNSSGGAPATNILSSTTSVTGATTLSSSAFGVLHQCSGTSANYTVTLPAVFGNGGKIIGFQMSTALTKLVTIAGNSTETIDGSNTRVMWAGETALLYCDGSAWAKIAGKTIPMVAGQTVSATQSIAASTAVKKTLGTALGANCPAAMNDTANSKIVIVRPSVYSCVYGFRLFNVSAGGSMEALLYVNGAEQGITFQYIPGVSYYPNANGVKNLTLAVNDYLEDYCRQYTGATQTAGVANENALFVTEIPQW